MSTWRWILDDDTADVSAGSGELFNKRMVEAAENQGSIVITVPFGTIKDAFFYSDAGRPGTPHWPVGAWSFDLDVLVGNARITAEIFVNRVAADGTAIENYGPGTSPQSLGTAGIKHFSGTTAAQVAVPLPDAAHRVRLGIKLTHSGAPGGETVTIGFGDAAEVLEVPIQVIPEPRRPTATDAAVVPGASLAGVVGSGTPAPVAGSVVMAGIAPDGSPIFIAGSAAGAAVASAGTVTAVAATAPISDPGKPSATGVSMDPTATATGMDPSATAAVIPPSGGIA